jgi:hypothetical protein
MLICFVFSQSSKISPPNPTERISGQHFTLSIVRDTEGGPWYPHVAEEKTENFYRFFAGRLAGVAPSDKLPAGHSVSSGRADSWDFEGEEPDGSWIALKFDRRNDVLSIASDLFLLQRWYYTCQEGVWYLSNSLLYLHRVLKGKLEIEQRAVPYMLEFGYVPFHFTPLKNVFGLRAGEVLAIDRRESRQFARARIPIGRRPPLQKADISERIGTALREAVASELRHTDSIVIPLSGGIDSRFLLGLALQILPSECVTAMTWGYPRSLDFSIGASLAKKLGVRHVGLPMDHRPLRDLLSDNFRNSEGMYWTYPDYPVKPFREILPTTSYVLSGYVGDGVFGRCDLTEESLQTRDDNDEEHLLRWVYRGISEASPVSHAEVQALLRAELSDFRAGFEAGVLRLPGADLREKYDRWMYETHWVNRVNFALELHRDRAFYLAPFVHRTVMNVAYALTASDRRGERAYFATLKEAFPELYAYPTKSHFGFSLERGMDVQILATRAWRKAWSEIDEAIGRPFGVILYHHPRTNYAHPRELTKKIHRPYVLECLDSLKNLDVFDPSSLDRIKNRYLRRKAVNSYLLRGLVTVHQWTKHYGKAG